MRTAILFLLGIAAPCAVMGWLSWRAMGEEDAVIQRQRVALYQQVAERAAREAGEAVQREWRVFAAVAEKLAGEDGSGERLHFAMRLRWPAAAVGFAVRETDGVMVAQAEPSGPAVTAFVERNGWVTDGEVRPWVVVAMNPGEREGGEGVAFGVVESERRVRPVYPSVALGRAVVPGPEMLSLAAMVRTGPSGMGTLRWEGEAQTVFWHRAVSGGGVIFCAVLNPGALAAVVGGLRLPVPDEDGELYLLDGKARPVMRWANEGAGMGGEAEVTRPLVAAEAGPMLPGWEAVVVVRDVRAFGRAAAAARWRLGMVVVAAAGAAAAGAFLILRDGRRSAREAREKTDFVSSVSHELKTPLTSIRMFSELLASEPAGGEERTARYAGIIGTEAARLGRLIDNVLAFARMERGVPPAEPVPMDFRGTVMETAEHFRPVLEQAGFGFEVAGPSGPVWLEGDADALRQVLVNLLSNAMKYGVGADGRREIRLELSVSGSEVRVTVGDRGNGVPKGHEARVFEKFHRAHDTLAGGTAGSGLGLTISRRIAEAHGGRLVYRVREGGGAEFVLTLVRRGEDAVEEAVILEKTDAALT